MSDLIDFGSPDEKSKNPSLAMPLIPAPESSFVEQSNSNKDILIPSDAKPSVVNNPFDKILNETVEYNQKKGDLFENIMQKAIRARSNSFRTTREIEMDNVFKDSKYSDTAKMNKTFDHLFTVANTSFQKDIPNDLGSTKGRTDTVPNIGFCPASPTLANLSILNYSAMNDSLSEEGSKNMKPENTKNILSRSVLQENFLRSTNRCQSRRSMSVTDIPANNLNSENNSQTFPSFVFEDPLNVAFRKGSVASSDKSNSSGQGVDYSYRSCFTDRFPDSDASIYAKMSNISSIPKIPSTSSFNSSGSIFSNGPMNRGFIDEKSKLSKSAKERNTQSVSDISELKKKYFAIKSRMSQSLMMEDIQNDSIANANDIRNKSNFIFKKPHEKSETKLIDVDIFVPDKTADIFVEQYSSSLSHSSTDSVFVDNKKLDKSILYEARTLAKTFEELADHSKSSDTPDDLFLNDSRYNIDLIPLSDDEANVESVDNLIELNVSPRNASQGKLKGNGDKFNSNQNNAKDNIVEEFEKEFIEPKNQEEKAMATTVLLDLQKLIKADNNPEAAKIMKDLENMLGVRCESNAEILTTCLQTTNLPAKSPKMLKNSVVPENCLEVKPKMKLNSSDNTRHEPAETIVRDVPDKMVSKVKNKSLSSLETDIEVSQSSLNKSDVSVEVPANEKLAKDILLAMAKILNGDSEMASPDLLQNLGSVLNLNKNTSKPINQNRTDWNKKDQLTVNPMVKSSSLKNLHSSYANKPARTLRRSSSVNKVTDEKSEHNGTFVRGNRSASTILDSSKRRASYTANSGKSVQPKSPAKPTLIRRSTFTSTVNSKDVDGKSKVDMPKPKLVDGMHRPVIKKKPVNETVAKKGPMKAVLPLGNMQRRASFGKKIAPIVGAITPPKPPPDTPSAFMIPSSTPNESGRMKKLPLPKASSTPDAVSKNALSYKCDISPVPSTAKSKLNSSRSPQNSISATEIRRRSFRLNKSTSPQKIPQRPPTPQKTPQKPPTPQKAGDSPDTRLPRLSSRLGIARTYSSDDVKNITASSLREIPKTPNSKVNRESILSPLRNSNKVNSPKLKPFNLISKLRGRVGNSSKNQSGKEKENHYST